MSSDPATWTTQQHEEISISDMEDGHLERTVAMLERDGYVSLSERFFWENAINPGNDTEAAYCIESDRERCLNSPVCIQLDVLRFELERRQKASKIDSLKDAVVEEARRNGSCNLCGNDVSGLFNALEALDAYNEAVKGS